MHRYTENAHFIRGTHVSPSKMSALSKIVLDKDPKAFQLQPGHVIIVPPLPMPLINLSISR